MTRLIEPVAILAVAAIVFGSGYSLAMLLAHFAGLGG